MRNQRLRFQRHMSPSHGRTGHHAAQHRFFLPTIMLFAYNTAVLRQRSTCRTLCHLLQIQQARRHQNQVREARGCSRVTWVFYPRHAGGMGVLRSTSTRRGIKSRSFQGLPDPPDEGSRSPRVLVLFRSTVGMTMLAQPSQSSRWALLARPFPPRRSMGQETSVFFRRHKTVLRNLHAP